MRFLLTFLLLALAGCATSPPTEDGPDTRQKWDKEHGYNFGT